MNITVKQIMELFSQHFRTSKHTGIKTFTFYRPYGSESKVIENGFDLTNYISVDSEDVSKDELVDHIFYDAPYSNSIRVYLTEGIE